MENLHLVDVIPTIIRHNSPVLSAPRPRNKIQSEEKYVQIQAEKC